MREGDVVVYCENRTVSPKLGIISSFRGTELDLTHVIMEDGKVVAMEALIGIVQMVSVL